jgi:predicted nucleic acid-binding protein
VTTSRTYLLDTNVLLALVRGGALGAALDERFGLRAAPQRPLICVVTHGEIKVLAQRNGWGAKKLAALDEALAAFVTVDINHPRVIDAYVELDLASQSHSDGARNMGKNDLWIAATAKAAGASLLTTDKDFEHLLGAQLDGFYIDPSSVSTAGD